MRALVALLLVTLTIPGEVLRPDPAAVAAAVLAPRERAAKAAPPAAPGVYRSASSAGTVPITSHTISKPAGVVTNDVLLAVITVRTAPTITAPSGWTLVRSDVSGTTVKQAVYRKVATGSDPASYTWTFSSASESAVGVIVAYSGVNTTTPVDVSGGQANASSTSVTAPSVTTTVANTMLVGFFGTADDATFTAPSGMTERTDTLLDASHDTAAETADVGQAAAGASGTKVATASKAAVNIGQLVALRPSGTITLRAVASSALTPTTSLTIATPAGVVADDVLAAAIVDRDADAVTPPAGWTHVRTDVNGGSLLQSVFVRTATAAEPANHTFTFGGPISDATGGMIAVDDIDPLSPIDTSGGQANASSTSVTAPSITTTVADTVLLGFFATADDRTFSAPAGMTERYDVKIDGADDVGSSAATVTQAAAGATGSKVATASGAALNIGALVALRPLGATTNLGLQAQHTFESWDLGAGDGLSANVATRNVVVSHPLISLPIRGSGVSVNLTYNAKDTANLGMGPGWRLDDFRRLRLNGDNTVTLSDATGARHTFTDPQTVGAITTYTRPATLYAALVKDTTPNPDRFTLTYRDQSTDKFDVLDGEGLLVRAEDRFANGVDLADTAGTNRLATITDTAPAPTARSTSPGARCPTASRASPTEVERAKTVLLAS